MLLGLAAITLAAAAQTTTRPEPAIKRTVVEDDQVRIEELRVRGQVQRITVSAQGVGRRALRDRAGRCGPRPVVAIQGHQRPAAVAVVLVLNSDRH